MEIKGEDYILEYQEGSNKFDLSLMYIKNAKDPEKRSEEFKIWGHDMSLIKCIQKVINYRISKENPVLNMKEYFKLYNEQLDELKDIVKLI